MTFCKPILLSLLLYNDCIWNRCLDVVITLCPSSLMHPIARFFKTVRNTNDTGYFIPHTLIDYFNVNYTNKVIRKQLFDALKQEYIDILHEIYYDSFIFDENTHLWSLSPFRISLPRDICHVIMSYSDIGQLMGIHCKQLLSKQRLFKPRIPILFGWIEFIGFCYCTVLHFIPYHSYQTWLSHVLFWVSL
eukprot:191919_1